MMENPWSWIFILGLCMISCADGFIGINWGRSSTQTLIPSMVVDLLLQNGIRDVRIFQQSNNVLEAFYNSGIKATTGLGNSLLDNYLNMSKVDWWINDKILQYDGIMDFRYATVGSNPFSPLFTNKMYFNVLGALKNIHTGLKNHNRTDIKVTIPHYTDILTVTKDSKPSEVDFRPDIKDKMVDYVRFLSQEECPFMVSVFPIHFVNTNDLDLEFGFMENNSTHQIKDKNGLIYTNAFEFLYDSLHWALEKADAGTVKIVIGAIGWPTDSYPGANAENAERFYRSFLPYIASGRGTPMRPNQSIDVFLNNLSDENLMVPQLGAFQRHWGIYKFNAEPKFRIDFSGQNTNPDYPSTGKGVIHMPNRWCVFNKNLDDPKLVEFMKAVACNASDCSSLEEGGSCYNLSYEDKISYAFNAYFQTKGQASKSLKDECNLGGLGVVVPDDPSKGTCEFPVEILSAEEAVSGATFGGAYSGGERAHGLVSASVGVLALSVIGMIM